MKKFRKALALMLALCMVIGLVPASLAADDSDGSGAVDGYLYNIVHVDCGRKYFSPESLKKIIDNAAAAGFNQVELYLSDNQGFRFALDDMSVTTTYGTYDLTPALGDGYSDGSKYPDYSGKYLTQSEMTEIIAYAKTKGIDIVPCINVPGHMGAILEEFSSFRYTKNSSISKSSIDLNSDEAVAFALGITEKYAEYFAGQGCNFYNIGADEYANDLSSMGFEGMGQTMYNKFVTFMNDAADIIIGKGMTPRAFNDGFYYKDYTSGQINQAYEVCYWTSGWSGYDVAAASTIASMGHKLINTHGDYYWVLGNSGWQCSATKASGFDYESFQGGTISNPAGSMFCIWCDVGNADGQDGGTAVVSNTADVIAAFGAALPAVEPTVNLSKLETVENNGVEVTAYALTGLSAAETAAPSIDGANNVKAWNVVPATETGNYSGSGSVRVPVPSGWNTSNMGAFIVNSDGSVSLIKGSYAEGYYTYTAPHFSVTGIYDVEAAALDAKDTVSSSGTPDVYELDTNGLDSGSQYLIVYRDSASSSTGLALNTSKGSTNVTISGNNATPSGDAGSALWTYTTGSNSRKYLSNGSSYLYPSRYLSLSSFEYVYALNIDSSTTAVSIKASGNGLYYIGNRNSNSYVKYSDSDGWTAGNGWQNFYFYKYTPGTATYTVDPALQSARIDALDDVENDGYTDESWTAYQNALTAAQNKLAEVSGATYNSEAEANEALADLTALVDALESAKNNLKKVRTITVIYKADGVTVRTETLKVADDAVSVALSASFTVDGMLYSVADTTLVLTDAATYTVNVTAVEEDLSTVDPLKVEYWITNRQVTAEGAEFKNISAEAAYGKNGVLIENLVPAEGTIDSNTTVYWKSTRLASGNKQTTDSGDNKTNSGTDFAYIRYWNGAWAYSADGAEWTNVASGDQIVAYYLQYVKVTDEIDSLVVDWGVVPSTSYNSTNFVLLDFAVKYESGERVPDAFPVSGRTQAFHCDPTDTNTVHQYNGGSSSDWYNNYREISMINARETLDYEVYMITVTPTSDSRKAQVAKNANTATSYTYGGTEKVIWVDDEANLGEFADESRHYTSISGKIAYSVGGEASVPSLEIFNRHGMLVTYYVRAKATPDSLSVHYVDTTDGVGSIEFYSYNIAVEQGTVFDANIALDKTISQGNRVINGTVTNSLGKQQTVSSVLSTLPALSAQYRYSEYECVELVRSDDGKDVYLYYKFNSVVMFVADFGLPIEIKASDLNSALTDENVISIDYSGSAGTKFGTLKVSGKTLVYTPSAVLTGTDIFNVTVSVESGNVSYRVYIVPATTVYYEEGFAKYSGSGWDRGASLGTGTQTTSSAGSGDYYGFDAKYAAEAAGPSNKTEATSTMINDEATFKFSGTGVDIYANCREDSGIMVVLLYAVNDDGTESLRKYYRVDTHTEAGASGVTSGQAVESYNLPVVSVSGLDYGSYKVVVRHGGYYADGNTVVKDIMFDGFRVFNTMNNAADSIVYAADGEASPNFDEIRDHVLNALGVANISDSESYTKEELDSAAGQIYNSTTGSGIVILSENCSIGTGIDVRDLLDNGPKNELFLRPGETLTFKLANGINNIQIGLKAVNASVSAAINGNPQTVTSSTDMFYELGDVAGQVITVTNNGEGILSVTDLKYFGTPSAEDEASGYSVFSRMSRANFMTAFSLMGMRSVSDDPADTTAGGAEDGSGSVSEPPASSSDTTVPADSSDVTTSAPDSSDVTTSAPDTSEAGDSEPSGPDGTTVSSGDNDETTSEPPADGEETDVSSENADNSGEDSGDPFTGSRNDILIWAVIALVSSAAAAAAIIMVRKKIL
ncbi:MAG: family 20 glycosylhydrolase [Clostridiales bacterium]|nr:family 20 glycosylhydrolase [Clostridiales bacterium]